jgi:hypothetical protein
MQSRVVLVVVVMEEGEGGWSEEEWLLNRCRGRSRSFPRRSSSTALCWDWRDVLLGCCLRLLSLNAGDSFAFLLTRKRVVTSLENTRDDCLRLAELRQNRVQHFSGVSA